MLDTKTRIIESFYGSFIDGRMVDEGTTPTFDSINPANGEVITSIQAGGQSEVDDAVPNAKAAFPAWRDLPGVEKGRIFLRIAETIKENTERLVYLEALDNGKSRMDAQFDVMTSARYFEYYAGLADKLAGETIPLGGHPHLLHPLRALRCHRAHRAVERSLPAGRPWCRPGPARRQHRRGQASRGHLHHHH